MIRILKMIDITKNIALRLKIARIASGFKTSKEFAKQDQFSYVNMLLFKKIILESATLIKKIADDHVTEAVNFCFELYNRMITLDAKEEERIKVIQIGLKSFFNGLGMRKDGSKINQNRMVS